MSRHPEDHAAHRAAWSETGKSTLTDGSQPIRILAGTLTGEGVSRFAASLDDGLSLLPLCVRSTRCTSCAVGIVPFALAVFDSFGDCGTFAQTAEELHFRDTRFLSCFATFAQSLDPFDNA
jgi:hypothetical protein